MGHRQRRAQFPDAMVRQRRRNLGGDMDQVEGQRPGQCQRGSRELKPLLLFRHSERRLRSEESLTTVLHNCLRGHLWKELLRCAQNDEFGAPRLFGDSHMLLTGIARQIEAQSRARTRRYEAEYLANIFGLDYELPLRAGQEAAELERRRPEVRLKNTSGAQGEASKRVCEVRIKRGGEKMAEGPLAGFHILRQYPATCYRNSC